MGRLLVTIFGFVIFVITIMSSVIAQEYVTNYASSFEVERGILVSGDINSLMFPDSDLLVINELGESDSLRLLINFSNINGEADSIFSIFRYRGGAGHEVSFEIHNGTEWIELGSYVNSVSFYNVNFDLSVFPDFNGLVRFNHGDGFNVNHFLDVDYVVVSSISLEEESFFIDLLRINLDDTFTLVFMIVALLGGVMTGLYLSPLFGGASLGLLGLLMVFSDFNILLGFIVVVIGVMMLFYDEPIIKK